MTDTYTSQYGGTSQGTSLQNLADAFSAITNAPNPSQGQDAATIAASQLASQAPSALQQTRQQLTSQSGVPQLQAGQMDLGKMFQLYLNDPTIAGQNSQVVNTQAPNIQDYIKMALNPQSVTMADPSKGFTVPSVATAAQGVAPGTSANIINSLNQATTQQQGIVNDYTGLASQNWQTAINSLTGLASLLGAKQDRALKQRAQDLEEFKAGYYPGMFDQTGSTSSQGPKTPNDYADRFMGGALRWSDIPAQFKTRVTQVVKDRGVNVEDIRSKYKGIDDAMTNIDTIESLWKKMPIAERFMPDVVVQNLGMVAPTKAKILSIFFNNLEPSIRMSAIGGRMSNQEVAWIKGAIVPAPGDSLTAAKGKLDALRQGLTQKAFDSSFVFGNSTTTSNQPAQAANGGYSVLGSY